MFTISLFMDTDDDAELYYDGKLYGFYSDNLHIVKSFVSRELAIAHIRQNVRVICGNKLDTYTLYWLDDSLNSLSIGNKVDGIHGNQTYTIELIQS